MRTLTTVGDTPLPLWGCPKHQVHMYRYRPTGQGCIATQMATRRETTNRHLSDSARFPRSEMVGDTEDTPINVTICKGLIQREKLNAERNPRIRPKENRKAVYLNGYEAQHCRQLPKLERCGVRPMINF